MLLIFKSTINLLVYKISRQPKLKSTLNNNKFDYLKLYQYILTGIQKKFHWK